MPPAGEHIWEWFWTLHRGRSYGLAANPIGYTDIASWAALTGAVPSPDEVRALKAMDAAYLNEAAKRKD